MPTQLYDKNQILDSCLPIFAQHRYDQVSTSMLAKVAGISKALIFHHFQSKKKLYLAVLDRCLQKAEVMLQDIPPPHLNHFFDAKSQNSYDKLLLMRLEPDLFQFLQRVFLHTPEVVKPEVEERYTSLLKAHQERWWSLFSQVPLKEGVNREQAYHLVKLVLSHFEERYLAEIQEKDWIDEQYIQEFIEERDQYLSMIRHGIENDAGSS